MKGQYYFNGEYIEPQDISVSCFDYGFNFGAGIYEVFAFCHGVPFQLAEHMERLSKGGAALGIPVNKTAIEEVCSTLIKKSKESNCAAKILYLRKKTLILWRVRMWERSSIALMDAYNIRLWIF